jgi:hypothetical protein
MDYRGFIIETDGEGNYHAYRDWIQDKSFLFFKWKKERREWINLHCYDEDTYGPNCCVIEPSESIEALKKDIDYHIDGWMPVSEEKGAHNATPY